MHCNCLPQRFFLQVMRAKGKTIKKYSGNLVTGLIICSVLKVKHFYVKFLEPSFLEGATFMTSTKRND